MPVYNEESYIRKCIESLLEQDYPRESMEWIFVDGNSSDKTKEIIEGFMVQYPYLIRLYDNPNKNSTVCNEYRDQSFYWKIYYKIRCS